MGRKESACVKRRRNRAAGTQKGAAGQTGTGELSQFPRHPLLQGHTTSSWAQGSGESVSDKPQAPTPPTNEPLGGPIPVTHTCAHMCTVWSNLTHPLQPVSGPRGPRAHLLPSPASSSDPPTHHLPCGPSPAPTEPRPQTPASPPLPPLTPVPSCDTAEQNACTVGQKGCFQTGGGARRACHPRHQRASWGGSFTPWARGEGVSSGAMGLPKRLGQEP